MKDPATLKTFGEGASGPGRNQKANNVTRYTEIFRSSHETITAGTDLSAVGVFWRFEPSLNNIQGEPSQETSPATPAGLHVARRYRINPTIADLIARLAGLGPDRRAA